VAVKGWEETGKALADTLDVESFGCTPIVEPEEQEEFTAFARAFYESEGWEPNTYVPAIWNFNPNDFNEVISFADSTSVSVPFLHVVSITEQRRNLFDSYSVPQVRQVIDSIMQTAGKESLEGMVTIMGIINGTKFENDPASMFLTPVYPASDPLTVRFVTCVVSLISHNYSL